MDHPVLNSDKLGVKDILLNRMMWQDPILLNQIDTLNSTMLSRAALTNRGGGDDSRRNINDECGYPDEIDAEDYRKLYDREPIASRVVQVLPMECWQVTPQVYEDEDVETVTPFEQAWHDLGKQLRGESYFQDEEGSPIWEHLMRLDILSGIGSFGVALLGIDDGKELSEPVDGFEDSQASQDSSQAIYGPESEHGAISLNPRPEKKKNPNTVNARRYPEDDEDQIEPPAYDPNEVDPNEDPNAQEDPEFDPSMQEEGVEPGNDEEDAQEEQFDEDGNPIETDSMEFGDVEVNMPRKLLFIRCFDETLVDVVQYESDSKSPRFGQPVMYNIKLTDPRFIKGGTGLTMNTAKVHWSRVLHVADNLGSSEVFGVPRMQTVYNRLLDLRKLLSGSAEMYWKGAFPGYNLSTHPQLGGDVSFDAQEIKEQMEQYMNGLQRYTALVGASMNSLAPQVVDPASQIQVQLEAICVRLAVPMRVFMGSERGELASSQDAGTWNDRLKQRQNGYLTPRMIVTFIDRLIKLQILPVPTGYSIVWPDLSAASDLEKAQKANMMTQALAGYVSGGIEQIMTLPDYLVKIMGFDEAEAKQIDENNAARPESDMLTMDPELDQQMAEAQMEQMTNPELVPDNIQTGDQHHYEAGSQDRAAELEHERIMSAQENGPQGGPPNGPPGQGSPPMSPNAGKGPPAQPGNPIPPKAGKKKPKFRGR